MKVISLDECCRRVDEAFKTQQTLKTADICEMIGCSLPSARKLISAMLSMGVIYELNNFKGRRFTQVSPEKRSQEHIRIYREKQHLLAERRKYKNPMIFLCGNGREGNQIFESCRHTSRLVEIDNLLRKTGKFH